MRIRGEERGDHGYRLFTLTEVRFGVPEPDECFKKMLLQDFCGEVRWPPEQCDLIIRKRVRHADTGVGATEKVLGWECTVRRREDPWLGFYAHTDESASVNTDKPATP